MTRLLHNKLCITFHNCDHKMRLNKVVYKAQTAIDIFGTISNGLIGIIIDQRSFHADTELHKRRYMWGKQNYALLSNETFHSSV